jgi:predicted Zn-dependent protease
MTMLSEQEAKAILDKVIGLSKGDDASATLTGGRTGNVRFALNNISTSGLVSESQLVVSVSRGRKTGIATTNELDDAALERAVRRAEELADLSPENEEFMPAVDKQEYRASSTFSRGTAELTPEARAEVAAASILPCRGNQLTAAGYFEDNTSYTAFANSRGNFAYQTTTGANYNCTVRTDDGTGSGWVQRNVQDASTFKAADAVAVAIDKARRSVEPRALEPGKYTVILEPEAVSGLLTFMLFTGFDARQADEGRSFMAKKGGGTRIGEQLFDARVNIHTDPWDSEVPALPWDGEGMARERRQIVADGKVVDLQHSRYWAKHKEVAPRAQPGNIIMAGGSKSTEELVKETRRGILVTRTWYIRMVDPQTVLLTGLTRDGTFYVENGEIRYPIKNFRFNESPVIMLNNIEELGRSERLASGFGGGLVLKVPSMKVRDFTFTSLSDAV